MLKNFFMRSREVDAEDKKKRIMDLMSQYKCTETEAKKFSKEEVVKHLANLQAVQFIDEMTYLLKFFSTAEMLKTRYLELTGKDISSVQAIEYCKTGFLATTEDEELFKKCIEEVADIVFNQERGIKSEEYELYLAILNSPILMQDDDFDEKGIMGYDIENHFSFLDDLEE